jgi:hypothetical protein
VPARTCRSDNAQQRRAALDPSGTPARSGEANPNATNQEAGEPVRAAGASAPRARDARQRRAHRKKARRESERSSSTVREDAKMVRSTAGPGKRLPSAGGAWPEAGVSVVEVREEVEGGMLRIVAPHRSSPCSTTSLLPLSMRSALT